MEKDLRALYIGYRAVENKDEILRLYFNIKTEFKYNIDFGNFFIVMCQMLDEHPGLELDIEKIYPDILVCLDKFFSLTFIVKVQEKKVESIKERVLIKIV